MLGLQSLRYKATDEQIKKARECSLNILLLLGAKIADCSRSSRPPQGAEAPPGQEGLGRWRRQRRFLLQVHRQG